MLCWVRKMDKRKLTKLIVQGVAVVYGLLGLLWIITGLYSAVIGILNSDRFGLFFMAPMGILLGGIVLAVAWQNLRRFGPNSIKNVTFLVVYTLFLILAPFDELSEEATWTRETEFLHILRFLIPLLLMLFLYSIISRKLIQMTIAKDIQQTNSVGSADNVR